MRQHISAWESGIRRIARLNRDALTHRDRIILPYLLSAVSIGALASANPRAVELGLAPSRFRSDPAALAKDRGLDHALSIRLIILREELRATADLLEQTDFLIRQLGK